MGSKKHKKESKKRKHRSRSRSPLDGEERERKRHRKHKDRKKDRSPDVEEVPVDSHLEREAEPSPAPSSGSSVRRHDGRDRSQESERETSPPPASGSTQESLSIEETNKLRAKLGLKPLEVAEKVDEDGKIKDDLGEFYHVPAANIAAQKKADKLRERLAERREKRDIDTKLQTTLLAEEAGEDDDDAAAWVKKSRDLDKQKQEAAKRAALLDEMDAVFGVGALVGEEQQLQRGQAYRAHHLKGLRVAHELDALPEERETVLTLADKEVLAEDGEDVLVNVNMVDDEKYRKNIEERKKALSGYQAYDEEAEIQAALGFSRPVLAKYDEEIDPAQGDRRRGFFIGDENALVEQKLKDMMRAELIAGGPDKVLETLQTPGPRPASDYLRPDEIHTNFKKIKKKGKPRRRAKQEPIDVEEHEAGSAPLDTDDTEVPAELPVALLDEDEVEVDTELQAALHRARRGRQGADRHAAVKLEEILHRVKEERPEDNEEAAGNMVLDATAEFCRTLGDIPTYGLAGNREHHAEIMDFERDEAEPEESAAGGAGGAWSSVDVRSDRPADLDHGGATGAGLEAEPALGAGVAGALRLALSKGYLERAGALPAPRPTRSSLAALAAAHYSIEDKTYGEDDKYGRRERGNHSGPLSEFREKSDFRPDIKLEYVDDEGRALCPKEAFRYLSHKFHGKGPGKNKQEKRIKKAVQEGLMKKMSSTDTPLNTLQMLQQKQRETHSPFVVLSGAKRDAVN